MRNKRNNWQKRLNRNIKNNKRAPMLDIRRETAFRYDLNIILENSTTLDRNIPSFIATTVSKASRQSTQDARDYVKEKCEEEIVDKEIQEDILRLLNRYTKYR